MKLIVLGANGRTGAHVVRRALEEGADVTAVVRSEATRPAMRHGRLDVVTGDPCDADFLTGVFRGQDVVISTLGGRRPTKSAASVYPRSADAIVKAARKGGLEKIVVTSTALLFPSRRWADRVLATLVRPVVQSAARMERTLRAADLDVTVARCGFLTDADATTYRAERDALPREGSSISRRGLAHFLVASSDATWSGHQVYGVSGPLETRA